MCERGVRVSLRGISLKFVHSMRGVCVLCTWSSCIVYVEFVCFLRGVCVLCMWSLCVLYVEFMCFVREINLQLVCPIFDEFMYVDLGRRFGSMCLHRCLSLSQHIGSQLLQRGRQFLGYMAVVLVHS